jgi:hypothetical protein
MYIVNNFTTTYFDFTCEDDYSWSIRCQVFPPSKGAKGTHGEPLEPDDEGYVDIVDIIHEEGSRATTNIFSKNDIQRIEELAWEYYNERKQMAYQEDDELPF